MGLEWIKNDLIFYPTVIFSYISLVYLIYSFILELYEGGIMLNIFYGIFIIYFIRMLTFVTGTSSKDFGISKREEAIEEFNNFMSRFEEEEEEIEVIEDNQQKEQYECDICSRKISKEQYQRDDGRCPTCVAEDTHVAMFDSEGEPY